MKEKLEYCEHCRYKTEKLVLVSSYLTGDMSLWLCPYCAEPKRWGNELITRLSYQLNLLEERLIKALKE